MYDNRNDTVLSLLCAVTASILLIYNSWTVSGLIFFACSGYFVSKMVFSSKVATPTDFHVVILGGGVSGICMGRKLNIMGIKYTILEKSGSLGGTWYDNIYPGVACDVPSHLYSFSFFQNPNWTRAFTKGPEILKYLQDAASKFGVYPHIQYGKRVVSATWNKTNRKWEVETADGSCYTGNYLISSCGGLHVPRTPHFPGAEKFKGVAMHTAVWKKDFDPKGKRVAVIGTGASAVQAVPNLSEMGVKSLTVFQRTPCWAPPRLDYEYPETVKKMFALLPITNTAHRWFFFLRNEFRYRALMTTSSWFTKFLSNYIHDVVRKYYRHVIKDPKMVEKLLPNYGMGCKRITPSDTYLQAFNKPFVQLVTDKIDCFTETGIKTADGSEREFDAIVYATGFDLMKSAKAYKLYGQSGKEVGEMMEDTPMGYYGITHPELPNLFWVLGPGTGLAHNSIIYMIECQVNYATDAIRQVLALNANSLRLKPQVMTDYWNWTQEMMKGKVFADNSSCVGWYRNERGVNWTLWPLDLISYWWYTRSCNINDFIVE